MKKKFFRDFYGGTASLSQTGDGRFRLVVRTSQGSLVASGKYATERGARIALGKLSDGWAQT